MNAVIPAVPAVILVDVVHAEPSHATIRSFRLAASATVADVLRLAAADPAFAALDVENATVGVFGRVVRFDHRLADGERVELYRGPAVDPKSARRARAKQMR